MDLDAVVEGGVISVLKDSLGSIKFFLNGRDQGIAFSGLPDSKCSSFHFFLLVLSLIFE
jgi:hypothetical protein